MAILEKKFGGQVPARKPELSIVPPAVARRPKLFDSVTRDCHLQRIRYLAMGYGLTWLVEQATFDRAGLDDLEDQELIALHEDMDKAMECRREGIAFDDVGLVRPQSKPIGEEYEADSWSGSTRVSGWM